MNKTFNPQHLFPLAVLVWVAIVIIYVIPIDHGPKKMLAAGICLLGIIIIAGIRALWRWLWGHVDPWGNHD